MQATYPPQFLMELPDGPEGVLATLKYMAGLIKRGKTHPAIRNKAASLVQQLKQKDYYGEICTLFDFVQNNIRYVRDVDGVETVHFPEQILAQEWGDCDDKVILLGSLLQSIGHPIRLVAVGFQPHNFSHVFLDTSFGRGRWLPLDPTEPHNPGWYPPGILEKMVWSV